MYCTDCFRKGSLEEVGYDVCEDGEERQYVCSCSNEIKGVVFDWNTGQVKFYGIYMKENSEMEYIKTY